MEPNTQQESSAAIPLAIVIGFAMIAIAIFFTSGKNEAEPVANAPADTSAAPANTIRAVSEDDYILGNPNAPIVMIEYSDYDCPFCKQFHTTMHQILDEYGVTGRLAWVYRQFPLVDLHPNATSLSEAALCVGDIGGNSAFWTFSDIIFESREGSEFTNITKLPEFAVAAGVDKALFNDCVASDRMLDALKADMADGLAAGAQGTPYTVIKVGNQQAVINGAQPYSVVKGTVENLFEQLDGTFDPTAPATEAAAAEETLN
jgi:protein-disulfide isomerase